MPTTISRVTTNPRGFVAAADLSEGSSGPQVLSLQKALLAAGFDPQGLDGEFGPKTRAAVMAFQRSRGIQVDGVAGTETMGRLRSTDVGRSNGRSRTDALREGDFGNDVAKLQTLLVKHGFYADDVDGSFGQQTRRAVVDFQRSKGVNADGVVRPELWSSLNGPVATRAVTAPKTDAQFRARILDVARGELGKREVGTNRGEILKYPNYFGRHAEAWCADFASWVMHQSGGKMNKAYCPYLLNELKRNGDWKGRHNPQPGDVVVFDWEGDGTADHVGIVEKVNSDGTINTIEGNAKDVHSGRQGVYRHTRSMSVIVGFGNPY